MQQDSRDRRARQEANDRADQERRDQERRHRETLSAIQRTWRNASHHSSTHHLVGLESLSMNQRYHYNDS
jgi:hypothetical protein